MSGLNVQLSVGKNYYYKILWQIKTIYGKYLVSVSTSVENFNSINIENNVGRILHMFLNPRSYTLVYSCTSKVQ